MRTRARMSGEGIVHFVRFRKLFYEKIRFVAAVLKLQRIVKK
jgi:hypothetical protein